MLASYLARTGFTVGSAPLRGPLAPLEESRLPMRVWATDIDPYLHLNNGRYLTLMDMGRLDLGVRTGLAALSLRRRWMPVAGAATVKFRRELRAFARFELSSRIAHWDERWLYFEHRMQVGETVHTWGAVKIAVRHKRTPISPADYLAAVGVTSPPPVLPPESDLARWVALQQASR